MPSPAPAKKQPLVARLGFFVLGGGASAWINTHLLEFAMQRWHWPYYEGYAFSASSTAFVFFLWSYFVNFRTSRIWKHCLGRYATTFLLALLLNYLIALCGLKRFGSSHLARLCVVYSVQSFTGGIKFLLYHFWVFPHADAAPEESAPAAS